jgi:hypothetical protein
MYNVTSKPKRISSKFGLIHIIYSSLVNNNLRCFLFFTKHPFTIFNFYLIKHHTLDGKIGGAGMSEL